MRCRMQWHTFICMCIVLLIAMYTSPVYGFPAKEVYEKTSRSVVLIFAKCQGKYDQVGAGSIISPDGLVITNAHVVVNKQTSKKCSNIGIYLRPKDVTGKFSSDLVHGYDATILDYSIDLDLALLKIVSPPKNLERIEIGNSDEIKIGEEVIAIGHPEQGGLWSLTYGRISGEIKNYLNVPGKDVFQTDTSINRGNSGGPLLDTRGYIVGVNSNIARLSEDKMPITGVNFAIKSSVLKNWLEREGYRIAYGKRSLMEKESTEIPYARPREKVLEKTEGKKIEPLKEEPKPEAVPEKKAEPPKEEKKEEKKIEGTEEGKKEEVKEPEKQEEERFKTPKRPYNYDELLQAAERELEDMMIEMREKIRKRQ